MNYLRFLIAERRFLAFGFALAFFSSFGQTFFISLFGDEIRGAFDLTHGSFGACYSLATLLSGLTIIWLGHSLDHVDLRTYSALLCIGLISACLAMSMAPFVVVLTVALVLLRLTGQGLLSHTAMTSMARYFGAQRGAALSVAGLGFPAGEALLPIVAVTAMVAIGWRQTWLAIAIILACVMLPLVLWLLRGHGDRHAAHLAPLESSSEDDVDATSATGSAGRQWTRRQVLGDIRFYLLLPGLAAPGFIVTGIFFHQAHLVETKGWSMPMFAGCFAVFAGVQLPSGLLAGPLVDRIGARRLLPVFVTPMVAGLCVLGSAAHEAVAVTFMALTGLTAGIGSPIVGAMWAEVYGVRHLGAIRAMVTAIFVFATAGSPIAMGLLIDAGITMNTISFMCAAYGALGAVLAWIALHLRKGESS